MLKMFFRADFCFADFPANTEEKERFFPLCVYVILGRISLLLMFIGSDRELIHFGALEGFNDLVE